MSVAGSGRVLNDDLLPPPTVTGILRIVLPPARMMQHQLSFIGFVSNMRLFLLINQLWKEGRNGGNVYLAKYTYIKHYGIYNKLVSAWETITKTAMRSLTLTQCRITS